MRAAGGVSRLSLTIVLSVTATAVWAFDSGSEPVYQLLPEIAVAGADVPDAAPGFVTTDMQDGKTVLRWGQLFRIASDPRIYGRFSGRDLALAENGDPALLLARSPTGHFLAVTSPGGSSGDAGVQIVPMTGDAAAAGLTAADLPSLLTSAACGAAGAAASGWSVASGADAPRADLLSAGWTDDYVLSATWRVPVAEGTAPADLKLFETAFQVTADGQPHLTSCTSVDAVPAPAARHVPQRDVIARLRTLTFVRLPVMAEPSGGKRPSVLVSGPGLAFSAVDAGDPAVRTALSGSQSYLQVVAAAPPQLAGATRQAAALARGRPDTDTSAPLAAFGAGSSSRAFIFRNGGGEGGGERGGEGGSGSGG